jgi:hypothetical protein
LYEVVPVGGVIGPNIIVPTFWLDSVLTTMPFDSTRVRVNGPSPPARTTLNVTCWPEVMVAWLGVREVRVGVEYAVTVLDGDEIAVSGIALLSVT